MLLLLIIRFGYSIAAGIAFWFGEPAPSRQYVAEYNAEVLALPESETAWRIVRRAALRPVPLIEGAKYPEMGIQATVPEDPLWPAMAKAVEEDAEGIELALRAVERTRIGMPLVVFRDNATPEENWAALDRVDPQANPSPMEVSLPHIGQIRTWCRQLAADSRIAAEAGDSKRVVRDLLAMQRLGGMAREPSMLISQLVDYAVNALVVNEVGYVLASYPGLLDEKQLETLVGELRRTRERLNNVDLKWEWAFLLDWIGRVYSDDGNGNGVATYSGVYGEARDQQVSKMQRVTGCILTSFFGVEVSPLAESRRELTDRIDAARAAIQQDIETKPWLRKSWAIDALLPGGAANIKQFTDFPLAVALPGLKDFVRSWTTTVAGLDVGILVVELELFRLRNGDYPRSLAELKERAPLGLPVDLMDGEPIRYLYRKGQLPLVYSIGVDRVDDAGRAAKDNLRAGWLSSKSKWESGSEWEKDRLRGDCVYWPPVTVQWIDEGEKPFVPRRPLRKP